MKKIFLTMFVAATLVGCTKSEINQVSGEGVEIALRSDIVDASEVVSRAPFEGAVSADNRLEARVVTSEVSGFTSFIANGTMEFNGEVAANYKQLEPGSSSKFPTNYGNTKPVYLYGVCPATGWTINNAVAEYTFAGNEDVLVAGKVSTTQQDVIDGAYETLRFKHALTRLEVKLSAASLTVAPVLVGDVTAIKLVGSTAAPVKNKVSANYASDLALTFSPPASATSLDFYGVSLGADGKKAYTDTPFSAYELTSVPTLVAYSLVAPVEATSAIIEEYFLEITTTDNVVNRIAVDLIGKDNNKFVGSTAGRSFTVSINFKSTEQIAVDAVVEDWDEQGEWKGEVAVGD